MFRRVHFCAITMMVVAGLFGCLTASGHLAETFAQDKKADPGVVAGTSTVLPAPPQPFQGIINLK